jgi:pSer/pThr/pTyr-binding forkhead associated (FHA) protein
MNELSAEAFQRACAFPQPLILTVTGPGTTPSQRHVLDRPYALIGREDGSCIQLKDPGVSRRHAYFQILAGRLFCFDMDSRTKIYWEDGPRLAGWVDFGAAVRIGPFSIRFESAPPEGAQANQKDAANPLEVPLSDPHELPQAGVEITESGEPRALLRLDRRLSLVGHGAAARIRFRDPCLSRYHCAIALTPSGIWAVDLLSIFSTRLNGETIRAAPLQNGDVLQIAGHELRFRIAERNQTGLVQRSNSTPPPSDFALETTASVPAYALQPLIKEFSLMHQQMMDQFQQTIMMFAKMFTKMHHDQQEMIQQEFDHLREITKELAELRGQAIANNTPREAPSAAKTKAPSETPAKAAMPAPASPKVAPKKTEPSVPPEKVVPADSVHSWVADRIANLEREQQSTWQKVLGFVMGK